MTTTPDTLNDDGVNVTASLDLNDHHTARPSEPEGDGHCLTCNFAAGWTDEVQGHSTTATSAEVELWTSGADLATMAAILRRVKSATWWARLSYPENPKFWNEAERRVLARSELTGRRGRKEA